MRSSLLRTFLSGALTLGLVGVASAGVSIQIGVQPESIPQCGMGKFFFSLANDGLEPIEARVCLSLAKDGQPILAGVCGRLPLAAGESLSREVGFWIPPIVPPGLYALKAEATGSDGSSDQSVAQLTVTPTPVSECQRPDPWPAGYDLLWVLLTGCGLQPDSPTPTQSATWGAIKALYR